MIKNNTRIEGHQQQYSIEPNYSNNASSQNNPQEALKNRLKDLAQHVFADNRLTFTKESEIAALAYVIDFMHADGNLDEAINEIKQCQDKAGLFSKINQIIIEKVNQPTDDSEEQIEGLREELFENDMMYLEMGTDLIKKGRDPSIGGWGEEKPSWLEKVDINEIMSSLNLQVKHEKSLKERIAELPPRDSVVV